jgi:hypothetical protein
MISIKQLVLLIALASLSISVNAIAMCPDMQVSGTSICCFAVEGRILAYGFASKACEFLHTPEKDEKFEKCCASTKV